MVKVGKCALIALMHKKWTLRSELTKKTSHCKSRDFLRKHRLKITTLRWNDSCRVFRSLISFTEVFWNILIQEAEKQLSWTLTTSRSPLKVVWTYQEAEKQLSWTLTTTRSPLKVWTYQEAEKQLSWTLTTTRSPLKVVWTYQAWSIRNSNRK